MIGTIDPARREVTVIGAGIAGLLAAYRLDAAGYRVTLVEKAERAGGVIATHRGEHGLAEAAVHSLLVTPAVRALCDELGVELTGVRERARYVWRGGRIRRFPLGPLDLARTLTRAYFALAQRGEDPARLSLERWARRHVGRAALDFAINPFLRGIYAARPSEIAVGAAFPKLVVPHGHSLVSAWVARRFTRRLPPVAAPGGAAAARAERPVMMSALRGMDSLTDALAARLRERLGDRFVIGRALETIPTAGNVVIATPADAAGALLADASPELGRALHGVRYAPLVSVTAIVPATAVPASVRGVGVLVPEREREPEALGILFNSSAFAGRVSDEGAAASFTLMFGGTGRPEAVEWSDDELRLRVDRELARLIGVRAAPIELRIHRWPRAIPVYSSELLDIWELARRSWCARPGRVLTGNWTGQVSVRGMIEESAALARA